MRRRRRGRFGRPHTIAELLAKQPRSLARQPGYGAMIAAFRASPRLQRIVIGSRCFSLLQRATIAPQNLHHFYRTYRLPADPFFPLFFSVKRGYLDARARQAEDRRRYILAAMRALPPEILGRIKYLGYLERHYNAAGESPVWNRSLFPGSRRAADACRRRSRDAWITEFRRHLSLLRSRYRRLPASVCNRVAACFALEITPREIPPEQPSATLVSRAYRRLSLEHHPDRGGEAAAFMEIKRARDVLARESASR